ncbi:flavin reductase family protein [Hydrogenobacter sp. T-2]|uniref:flavin reductase family protein n=1 Tax=Pampinifervens diazotrophicum TaxID=1632018 RepID=UPI002B25ECA4|nr:flavin reductase family protein [Hydrogenobacter sp. T-2]WPM32893.1 flavin reductase family protein [Hydrogenobacter sp. T-2]
MMLFDMEKPQGFDPYEVLTRLVVPRPTAWVSTLSPEGIPNLAPFSFYNAVCDEPPVVLISISKRENHQRKDTSRNILATREFVINFVSEDLLKEVELSSRDFPPEISEFEVCKLQEAKAYKVEAPRVAKARAWLECRLLKHEELFDYDLIFGRVVFAGVESFEVASLKPVGRLSGKFCRIVEINQAPNQP